MVVWLHLFSAGGVLLAASRDSLSGPDAMDVAIALAAIQDVYGVSVTILVSHGGRFGSGGLSLQAVASSAQVGRSGRVPSVSRRHRYPNDESKTLEGALFKLVYELERDCDQLWGEENTTTA